MGTAQTIMAFLGTAGGGAVLLALVNGIIKWLSGSSARERRRNTNLITQRQNAVIARDEADVKRREAEEHVSILKRQLLELGVEPLERESKKEKSDE